MGLVDRPAHPCFEILARGSASLTTTTAMKTASDDDNNDELPTTTTGIVCVAAGKPDPRSAPRRRCTRQGSRGHV